MRRRRRGTMWQLAGGASLVILLVGVLSSAGCGGSSTPIGKATATATPNLKGAETPLPTPTLPYGFPASWRAPANGPEGVVSFVFAPSAPQIGYACAGWPPDGAQTPSTRPAPALDVTRDGGATWQALRAGPLARGCYAVFVDSADAGDVFIAVAGIWQSSSSQSTNEIWRSRDGGASWRQLAAPDPNDPVHVENVVVVGGRIVVSIYRDGAGIVPYSLLGSDDAGATWQPLGRDLTAQGYYVFGPLAAAGPILYASLDINCSGGCVERTPPATLPPAPKGGVTYFRSADRGTTWQPVSLPGQIACWTRSASGAYYGLARSYSGNPSDPVAFSWSRDGGATWSKLPTMAGIQGGYVDPASAGAGALTIAPDGSVVAGALHQYAPNQSIFAGLFVLRAGDASPAWRLLAPPVAQSPSVQAVPTATGIRLWGVQDYVPQGSRLIYIDLA